jgi:nucleoside-diphosphate-sugar epimerase
VLVAKWENGVADKIYGVIGATSLVGAALLPRLVASNCRVAAFSRRKPESENSNLRPGSLVWNPKGVEITHWISLAPIWVLAELLPMLEDRGARKVVVLSTTSLFTKSRSESPAEQRLVEGIRTSEAKLAEWAGKHDIEWVVLRPTLIYGLGKDRNISEIARMINRFGFFPLLGEGVGLRQPIHAEDVAQACQAALDLPEIKNRAYNISGCEQLSYREMVLRIFRCMDKQERLVSIPRWAFTMILLLLRRFRRFQDWSVAMVDRMNQDMVFDHAEAEQDIGFKPRPFRLEAGDLP